jgi:asparagine synthase (glutamine-hydrolysing)
MLVFDGRLDNHQELSELLDIRDLPDSSIVLSAFAQWNEDCFSRLIGDWALALWSQLDQSLYLARDHAGTRTLYFDERGGCIRWATFLETLVDSDTSRPDQTYIADHLASRPTQNRTPYDGISQVPPAHYLKFRGGRMVCRKHWTWINEDMIRYKHDSEYEEQFLSLFRRSVGRRTGPGAPVLAQLSGGMDSTSIVCMSDHIQRTDNPSAPTLIHTISYYDDEEPNWNERPYFSLVESRRGRQGFHIDSGLRRRSWSKEGRLDGPYLLPGMDSNAYQRERDLLERIRSAGYRVILSGLGGDELLGGVPTPFPELADCLFTFRWHRLFRLAVAWCVIDRSPLYSMLCQTIRLALACYRSGPTDDNAPPPWLTANILRSRSKGASKPCRFSLSLPSESCRAEAWCSILENLPHSAPSCLVRYEYRYPYLDRDLASFLMRVPREQLVRPGQRRSLMRRALQGIVPPEILGRRRKAYLIRQPVLGLQNIACELSAADINSLQIVQAGYVEPKIFEYALRQVATGQRLEWASPLWRTLLFDLWLRSTPFTFARHSPRSQDPRELSRPLRGDPVEIQSKEVSSCAT